MLTLAIVHIQQHVAYHLNRTEKERVLKWILEDLRVGGFQIQRKYYSHEVWVS